MGQLSDYDLPTESVTLRGGKQIALRGLAFEDLWIIAQAHGVQATLLFEKMVNREKLEFAEARAIFSGLLPQVPELVATAIACAADDYPAGVQNARRIGPRVQLEALEKIFKLTIESEAEVKALGEDLVRILVEVTGFAKALKAPLSEAGFGESVVE